MKNLQIAVIGAGFVGTSIFAILSEENKVIIHDIDENKIKKIKLGKSPIEEAGISKLLKKNKKNLEATINIKRAVKKSDYIVIAVPTDFDEGLNRFDTSILEEVIVTSFKYNPNATVVIKSTIPIGFTESQSKLYPESKILYSPEFLREGSTVEDNLNPSRIIVGGDEKDKKSMSEFASLLKSVSMKHDARTLFMNSSEAEAVKLFSNTYLAMRVAFFNELDSFALDNNLNAVNIINGVCEDKRIGNFYNNPSFGYGGYCLPKDSKQLRSSFNNTPQNLIDSIILSNDSRKNFLSSYIKSLGHKKVGVYRLVMKESSSNYRSSAIQDIIIDLRKSGLEVVIYEPLIEDNYFLESQILNNISIFKETAEIIIANREHKDLEDVKDKIFTRDLFNKDV